MGYATNYHVEAYCAWRVPSPGVPAFTASSRPTASQVGLFCEEVSAEIDASLRTRGYAIPVATTATSALGYLQRLTAIGAWASVESAADNSIDRDRAERLYNHMMRMLNTGVVTLDTPEDTVGELARTNVGATPYFAVDSIF